MTPPKNIFGEMMNFSANCVRSRQSMHELEDGGKELKYLSDTKSE